MVVLNNKQEAWYICITIIHMYQASYLWKADLVESPGPSWDKELLRMAAASL